VPFSSLNTRRGVGDWLAVAEEEAIFPVWSSFF
jgi:hypothetical protein